LNKSVLPLNSTRSWSLVGWLASVIGWNPVATGHKVAIETRDLIIIPHYRAVQLKHKADATEIYSIGQYVSGKHREDVKTTDTAITDSATISDVRAYVFSIPYNSVEPGYCCRSKDYLQAG
jgi:hypothetical protein